MTEIEVLKQNLEDTEIVSKALEKENAELQKENENLKSVAEYQQSSNMKRYFEIEELKKENASLKDALEGYKQNAKWCDKCDKIVELEKENATLKKQLEALSGDKVIDLRDRAEQFLSEEEK